MSKKLEIREKARIYAEQLFPVILEVIENEYDYYHQKDYKLTDPHKIFPNIRLDITFESYTHPQKTFLFELLDKRFDAFMKRDWYDFNSLTKRAHEDGFEKMKKPEELNFLLSKEFMKSIEKVIEGRRSKIAEMYTQMREELIYEVFANIEPVQNIDEPEDSNYLYDLLDDVRNKDHSYLELYNIIKRETQLEKVPLQYFKKDIELYLFVEKDIQESYYSTDEVDIALKKLEDNGYTEKRLFDLGYLKKGKLLNGKDIKNAEGYTYVDKENLLFPFEFYSIYDLLRIINTELEKLRVKEEQDNATNPVTPNLKTNFSVPQLALLFKMINDLKPKVFNTNSDAELFRFISANFETKKSSDNGISTNKLRNEFNSPELKSIEFWEKHLHTMLSDVRKLK